MNTLKMLLSYTIAIMITVLLVAGFATLGLVAMGIFVSLLIAAAIYRSCSRFKAQRDVDPVVRTY
ncbi:MAG: hypothetical protein HRU05_04250 [Oceanospirillaceae bacterium]|nr:hypothetical protein [Oceanospirillaceae bacterium]